MKRLSLLVAVGVGCMLVQSAQATLLFSDGFNYTVGDNLGAGSTTPPWTLERFNKNCSHLPGALVGFWHANEFTGSAGTNPGFLRQRRGHACRDCPSLPGFVGAGQEASPATSAHQRHRATAPVLRAQTHDCGHPPKPAARLAGPEERSNPQGNAGGSGAEVFLAGDQRRLGEDGPDI